MQTSSNLLSCSKTTIMAITAFQGTETFRTCRLRLQVVAQHQTVEDAEGGTIKDYVHSTSRTNNLGYSEKATATALSSATVAPSHICGRLCNCQCTIAAGFVMVKQQRVCEERHCNCRVFNICCGVRHWRCVHILQIVQLQNICVAPQTFKALYQRSIPRPTKVLEV